MICNACSEIFSTPRKLTYGTYYPWNQTVDSYVTALAKGCQLCNLIEENRSYKQESSVAFPVDIKYSFKSLSSDWARHGNGPKWLVPHDYSVDDDVRSAIVLYLMEVGRDPTPNGLGHLLATDSEELERTSDDFWLVLEFYGPLSHLVLPLEFIRQGHLPTLEQLAQSNLAGQQSSGSKENLELARNWLHNCKHQHPTCKSQKTEPWLPTRLLYVGSQASPTCRLVLSSTISNENEYAALSHRWGSNQDHMLTSSNRAQRMENILTSELSATFQDAVEVTRGLGLEYLWVDSMCIVQDDEEDWARESATMFRVYSLSTCTIAAANSGLGGAGCFTTRNPHRVRPCIIPNPFKTDSKYSFYVRSDYMHQIHRREVKESLWYDRGWVFQERTLSRRLLIFGKTQMLWACEQIQAAEMWPCGKTSLNYIDQFESFEVERARFNALLDRKKGSQRSTTPGLVTQIEGLTGQRYCAGFWLNDSLPLSLLWAAAKPPFPRPSEYRAPSWSWASVDSAINFNHDTSFKLWLECQFLGSHEISDRQATQRGSRKVTRVALQLSGMLLPAFLRTYNGAGNYELRHNIVVEEVEEVKLPKENSELNFAAEDSGVSKARATKHFRPLSFIASLREKKSIKANQKEKARLQAAAERDLRRANQEDLARRRQKVEEGLKLIGTPGWQDMLLQNTLEEDEDFTEELAPSYHAASASYTVPNCFYDAPLDTPCDLETFFMPIAQNGTKGWSKVRGLLVQIVDGSPDETYYRRVGMFEVEAWELRKFRPTMELRNILLV